MPPSRRRPTSARRLVEAALVARDQRHPRAPLRQDRAVASPMPLDPPVTMACMPVDRRHGLIVPRSDRLVPSRGAPTAPPARDGCARGSPAPSRRRPGRGRCHDPSTCRGASSRSRSPARAAGATARLLERRRKWSRPAGRPRRAATLFRDVPAGHRLPRERRRHAAAARSRSRARPTRPTRRLHRPAARRRLRLHQDHATARCCRSTSRCPGRPRTAPTPPSSSTRATTRRTPTAANPRRARPAARLRDRRREPARHRLLGRRVRLLRAAPVARRLRRDRGRRRAAVGADGTVGMVGISYPGLTQLFVAATRPPHLAAITPLSVLDDTYDPRTRAGS